MDKKGLITGTFIDEITYDIPSSNWGVEEWKKELDYMKEFGIDTLVFIRGGFMDQTIFPSKTFATEDASDLAGLILTEAAKRDMNVFMGLYISNINWNKGDYIGEIKKNKAFMDEILHRYGDVPSFNGWYIPHETSSRDKNISEVFKGISYLCKEKAPEKSVLVSPVIQTIITCPQHPMTPEQYCEEWDSIFAECAENIDICAYQDGTAPLNMMSDYFNEIKKLCDKYNMHHWVNCESFERDVRRMYYPISFEVMRKRLEKHKEYAEKIITFEFSHFLSPQSIYPSARNLNKRYREFFGI